MFAVPGWTLSAPLTTQVDRATSAEEKGRKKRKRKRGGRGEEDVPAVDGAELGGLWETVIEGKKKGGGGKEIRNGELREDENRKNKKRRKYIEGEGEMGGEVMGELNEGREKPKKRERSQRASQNPASTPSKELVASSASSAPAPTPAAAPNPSTSTGLTPLQASMRHKLASARFRHLNETLYTHPGAHALALFHDNPSFFADYHAGFAQQVAAWPQNPVDRLTADIAARAPLSLFPALDSQRRSHRRDGKHKGGDGGKPARPQPPPPSSSALKPLPRPRRNAPCVIADLGCGTARLATLLAPHLSPLRLRIHSFDLANPSSSPVITVADAASGAPLPGLADGSVDVAVFCLALMGTDWPRAVDEAWRVLRPGGGGPPGELWVAEIKSRFGRRGPSARRIPDRALLELNAEGRLPGESAEALPFPSSSTSASGAAEKKRPAGKKARKVEEAADHHGDVAAAGVEEAKEDETDVAPFVRVLRRRGFALDSDAPRVAGGDRVPAVERANRMFVGMRFVKVGRGDEGGGKAKMGMGGGVKRGGGGRVGGLVKGELRLEEAVRTDAKVLGPCLYKLR